MISKYLKIPSLIGPNTFDLGHFRNRLQLVRDYAERTTVTRGFPTIVEFEVSSRCNMSCVMCPRENVNVEQHMDLDLYKRCVDQIAGRAEMVILHASGEPLLHPDICEMIRYCSDRGVGTWLSTNAMLLDEKRSIELMESGLDSLVIAIDGDTKETYERIRVHGVFETVVANAERFLKLRRQRKSNIMATVQFIEMEENRQEADAFLARWGRYEDVNVFVKAIVNWFTDDSDLVPHPEFSEVGNSLRYPDLVCDRPWFWMIVKSTGLVPLCAHDIPPDYVIGDANMQSLDDIWNSEQMRSYREMVAKGKPYHPLCKSCDYCPARPHTTTGNLALASLDMLSVAKILFSVGYKKVG
ncbi:MAG: hypothetical protein CME19_18145 [Gemmatimonadetes bacterium]|nr:hypothetical protein [Gemmatimonadota bacterium]